MNKSNLECYYECIGKILKILSSTTVILLKQNNDEAKPYV